MTSGPIEYTDILIVGAGLSGVGAACQLRQECPDKSVVVLEGRGAIGGVANGMKPLCPMVGRAEQVAQSTHPPLPR
jgi:cation diffusion facilitator CzcD-associated flavoprotein CzcO